MRSSVIASFFVILASLATSGNAQSRPESTTQPATRPTATTAPSIRLATTQPTNDLVQGAAALASLEADMRTRNADGVRQLVLLGNDRSAAAVLESIVNIAKEGRLADARVVPMDGKADGDVMVIAAVFARTAHDVDPDTDPAWFVRREGAWRLILSGTNERGIMSDAERQSADRLQSWYDAWHQANVAKVREEMKR